MTRRHATRLCVLAGILAILGPRPALAGDGRCPAVVVEADASLTARWPGLVGQLRGAFDAREDIDRCARVVLTRRGAAVEVAVVLPDGRSAARPVTRREDVVPTLEALLLVPQPGAAPAEAQPQEAQPEPPAPAPPAPQPPVDLLPPVASAPSAQDVVTVPPPPRPRGRLRIELSVVTGARIGDGQTGVGLGAFSLLELSGWLVGFEGRADRYRGLTGTPPSDGGALELAVLGGRRWRFGDTALDLTAGPAAALQGTTTFESRSAVTGTTFSESSTSTVPRLLLGARVGFGARSTLHTFVGVDGELGPARSGGLDIPNASRLPLWTLGLALGATVGTP